MDPLADMLIKIKNAGTARHEVVVIPVSQMKKSVLDCLKKEGYIGGISEKTNDGRPVFEVVLKYDDAKQPKITQVERVSKPSRRMYAGVKDIKLVKNGKGIVVLSTPKGILSGREARKEMVGGELLFTLW